MRPVHTTVTAPTNIAVIKYWGKENVPLNTPLNSSISLTLDQKTLCTTTSIAASPDFAQHRLWLNGHEQVVSPRILHLIQLLLPLAQDTIHEDRVIPASAWSTFRFHMASSNSFPTAAGLASSASGYAALVFALAQLMHCQESFPGQFSTISRQGSGSAVRSWHGGLVEWQKGKLADGSDSKAVACADADHWPELQAIVCVVNAQAKATSSTEGMRRSKATSVLLAHRVTAVVPDRLQRLKRAFAQCDFEQFGRLTMEDSNQFHATCLDTYPPIFYLNETSQAIIELVHRFNAHQGAICAAYTFDAGPNAVLFVQEQHVQDLMALLLHYFPPPPLAYLTYVFLVVALTL